MESGRALKCSSIKRRSLWKSTSLGWIASGERLGELGVAIWWFGSSTENVNAVSQIFEQ